MNPITVLIVDDHTVAREGLRAMLQTDGRVKVVGEATDGQEGVELTAGLLPAVVLMDIRMPKMDGLEATRRIRAEQPTVAVIMMTSYDDTALVVDAIRAGASGFLLKDTSASLLVSSIEAVASGGMAIKAPLMRRAINSLTRVRQPNGQTAEEVAGAQLTEREREVLRLIAEGWTNREIGDALCLAEVTVKKRVQGITAKLRVSDRTQAAIVALRMGLIE